MKIQIKSNSQNHQLGQKTKHREAPIGRANLPKALNLKVIQKQRLQALLPKAVQKTAQKAAPVQAQKAPLPKAARLLPKTPLKAILQAPQKTQLCQLQKARLHPPQKTALRLQAKLLKKLIQKKPTQKLELFLPSLQLKTDTFKNYIKRTSGLICSRKSFLYFLFNLNSLMQKSNSAIKASLNKYLPAYHNAI